MKMETQVGTKQPSLQFFGGKKDRELNKALAKKKSRVVPIKSHLLNDKVTTIGFKISQVRAASSLKGSLEELKEDLGGKAAGLLEMSKLGISVPPAVNLSTHLCLVYLQKQKLPEVVVTQTRLAIEGMQRQLGKKFGHSENPLLVSVRSGARVSMPGMMDTILNLGLNTQITRDLVARQPTKARFWWDCYRRLVQMYSTVVLQMEHDFFERAIESAKNKEGVSTDAELPEAALEKLTIEFLNYVNSSAKGFPQDPWSQLTGAIEAVFRSWNTDRAIHYRKLNDIPEEWGTSVTIQAMVFGNLNDKSGTGVVFTRNPSTGTCEIYGEYLMNAQGEDVVAGIRTPKSITTLKADLPKAYRQLVSDLKKLECHFNDVQDVEFTIENETLYILQTRSAKRTAVSALEHAHQFCREKKLKPEQALFRLSFDQVKQLLHPTLDASSTAEAIVTGLPASPGAASGRVAFDPETAQAFNRAGVKTILVRRETSPEDIMGMSASEGILTSTGGMTSHAAVVARGMGKTCVVGCSDLNVNEAQRFAEVEGGTRFAEGDWITLDGSTGNVYLGELPTQPVTWGKTATTFFGWADKHSKFPVLANADTPDQAKLALSLGAQGIGLCRTEHMFFDKERIRKFRLMVLSDSTEERSRYANELLVYQREDFIQIFKEMKGLSICVRLLDPPLHEFLPKLEDLDELSGLCEPLQVSATKLEGRIRGLHESNPMLGHRGCRLGITFPEIYQMQIRALAEAMLESFARGIKVQLKIMIPLTMSAVELRYLLKDLRNTWRETLENSNSKWATKVSEHTKWGSMIELPRAAVTIDTFAHLLDFISFGTNDLTQTTLGISRDDASKFIPSYRERGLLANDPFESLDQEGVGRLIEYAVVEGRKANPQLEIGICGEHGGDPESIEFFERLEFDSISCSPYRVPIARLAAARASLKKKLPVLRKPTKIKRKR